MLEHNLAAPHTLSPSAPRQDAKTWLVNPVLEQGSKGQLIMMFRTAAGGWVGVGGLCGTGKAVASWQGKPGR